MNIVVNVNKPKGMTSFGAVRGIRRLLQIKKVGHLGTLDPMATGVLPIFVGKATKLIPLFNGMDKEYCATMKLGEATDTFDAEGKVVAQTDIGRVTPSHVEACITRFQGSQKQLAPIYSAVKYNGVPAYQLARQGKTIERKERQVFIESIQIKSIELPFVTFRVKCSKGTYIRSLVDDIGQALAVGAHLSELERIAVGPYFSLDNAYSLSEILVLQKQKDSIYQINPTEILEDFHTIEVTDEGRQRLRYGQPISIEKPQNWEEDGGNGEQEPRAQVVDEQTNLVAIGVIVVHQKHFQFNPTKIFI